MTWNFLEFLFKVIALGDMMSKYFIVVVRGEIARRQYKDSLESKPKVAKKENDEQLVAVVQIQSGKVFLRHLML